ncbi:MAG: DUF692 domain-containing protein [Alphaproteobacteria bacterium]|nr:DUF692 domain-containing protein [Alphaproteobacteria bacterium]
MVKDVNIAAGIKTGIGLRGAHTAAVIDTRPPVGFLEGHSENYFRIGGAPFEQLMECREAYPVSLHGVGLSLGSAGGVSPDHLQKLKTLVDIVQPDLVSEHVSWSAADGKALPDLLPLPMTREALETICANISHVQDVLQRKILVENPSSYLRFAGQEMAEPAFLAAVAKTTGCGILLDVNNIAVSAHNMDFDAAAYIDALPPGIVGEIHLAGYQVNTIGGDSIFIDAHNHAVYDGVWDLYARALARFGDVPTLVEWDADLPPLPVLVAEAAKADAVRARITGVPHAKIA